MSSVYRKYQPNHLDRPDKNEYKEILIQRPAKQQKLNTQLPKKQEHSVIQYYGKKDLFTKSQQRNNCFPYISSHYASTSQLSGQLNLDSSQRSSSHESFRMYHNHSSIDCKKLGTTQPPQRVVKPKVTPRSQSNQVSQIRSKSSNYRQLTSSRFEQLQNNAIEFQQQCMENKFKNYFDLKGVDKSNTIKAQNSIKKYGDIIIQSVKQTTGGQNKSKKSDQTRLLQLVNAIESDYYKINGKFVCKATYLLILQKLEGELIEFQQCVKYVKESEIYAQNTANALKTKEKEHKTQQQNEDQNKVEDDKVDTNENKVQVTSN